ncbi:DUF4112 domain-containing protein [Marivita sp. S2033]
MERHDTSHTSLPDADSAHRLAQLERLAGILDSRFRVPIIGFRIGWDSILGLIPGVGDVATVVPAGYFIWHAHRMGTRKWVLARMGVNTGIDMVIGSIPLVGDLFDASYKSNLKNLALLKAEMQQKVVKASKMEVSNA